jgi:hypothetical protein
MEEQDIANSDSSTVTILENELTDWNSFIEKFHTKWKSVMYSEESLSQFDIDLSTAFADFSIFKGLGEPLFYSGKPGSKLVFIVNQCTEKDIESRSIFASTVCNDLLESFMCFEYYCIPLIPFHLPKNWTFDTYGHEPTPLQAILRIYRDGLSKIFFDRLKMINPVHVIFYGKDAFNCAISVGIAKRPQINTRGDGMIAIAKNPITVQGSRGLMYWYLNYNPWYIFMHKKDPTYSDIDPVYIFNTVNGSVADRLYKSNTTKPWAETLKIMKDASKNLKTKKRNIQHLSTVDRQLIKGKKLRENDE